MIDRDAQGSRQRAGRVHRPQAGTVPGSIRRENRARRVNPGASGQPPGRCEQMHQGARPLPAAHRQFVMRRTAVFGYTPVTTAMLMLFRMPDDHDLQHAGDSMVVVGNACTTTRSWTTLSGGKGTKKGAHLRGLWLRLAWLATVLALAIPATAAPLHRIVAVGDLHGDFSAWRAILRRAPTATMRCNGAAVAGVVEGQDHLQPAKAQQP